MGSRIKIQNIFIISFFVIKKKKKKVVYMELVIKTNLI